MLSMPAPPPPHLSFLLHFVGAADWRPQYHLPAHQWRDEAAEKGDVFPTESRYTLTYTHADAKK